MNTQLDHKMDNILNSIIGERAKSSKQKKLKQNVPVFSFISHKTLNRAGFILWQFSACFLKKKKKRGQDITFHISIQTSGNSNKATLKSLRSQNIIDFPQMFLLLVLLQEVS